MLLALGSELVHLGLVLVVDLLAVSLELLGVLLHGHNDRKPLLRGKLNRLFQGGLLLLVLRDPLLGGFLGLTVFLAHLMDKLKHLLVEFSLLLHQLTLFLVDLLHLLQHGRMILSELLGLGADASGMELGVDAGTLVEVVSGDLVVALDLAPAPLEPAVDVGVDTVDHSMDLGVHNGLDAVLDDGLHVLLVELVGLVHRLLVGSLDLLHVGLVLGSDLLRELLHELGLLEVTSSNLLRKGGGGRSLGHEVGFKAVVDLLSVLSKLLVDFVATGGAGNERKGDGTHEKFHVSKSDFVF